MFAPPTRLAGRDLFSGFNQQDPEIPLVFFTVISQAVAGAVIYLFLFAGPEAVRSGSLHIHLLLLLLLVLAQGASFLHLGRKAAAYRALSGLFHSWLSAEIAAAGLLCFVVAAAAALAVVGNLSPFLLRLVVGAEAIAGVLLLACMIKLYMLPSRPLWNTLYTPISFIGSANLLGLHVVLLLGDKPYALTTAVNVGTTVLILLAHQIWHYRRFGLWPTILQPPAPVDGLSAVRDVRSIFIVRNLFGIGLPFFLVVFSAPVILGAVFILLGELLGRVLFYKVSPATGQFGALYL
jgi:DMSO reductase anchor subunit